MDGDIGASVRARRWRARSRLKRTAMDAFTKIIGGTSSSALESGVEFEDATDGIECGDRGRRAVSSVPRAASDGSVREPFDL